MTRKPESRRSPLLWSAHPPGSVEIEADGRQRSVAHREGTFWTPVPGTDQKTRTLHGVTKRPTIKDGYHAQVALRLQPDGGIKVVSVKLHPSETVFEGGPERDRTPVEETLSPIDSAAWSLIRISDLKRAIAAIDADVVSLAPRLKEEVEELSRLANRRRSPNVEARQARRAEQVLQAMAASDGVAYRGLLPEMFPDPDDWGGCTNETIKQRVRRLRKDGWLPPPDQYGRPGPRLIAWREERHR